MHKGVVAAVTWGIPRWEIYREVDAMKRAGVTLARINVPWSAIERTAKGSYNYSYLADIDYAVTLLSNAGIKIIMPIADGVPYWASADPDKRDGVWNVRWKPTYTCDYRDFCRFIADRYRSRVGHYEIWNEPNHPHFWPSGPSAGDYLPLLRSGYRGVKSVAPEAVVISGGISQNDWRYLDALYTAGGGEWCDAVATHAYPWADPAMCWRDGSGRFAGDSICGITEVRRVMLKYGDGASQLWVTELGFSTSVLDEATQAIFLRRALAWCSARPYIAGTCVYNLRERGTSAYNRKLGLLHPNFAPKPAYHVLAAWK
jgi:hypothetical protein